MNSSKYLFRAVVAIAVIALGIVSLSAQDVRQPRQEKLLNGMKLLMWSDASADKVTLTVRIHSGSAFDPQGKEGVMSLLSEAFFPTESARAFFTEDIGGTFDLRVNYDYIQVTTSSKPENFLTMIETVATAVAAPTTDKETTQKLKTAQLERLKQAEASPVYLARIAAAKRLFGTFPYGRPILGTAGSISKIDFADLIAAKQRFLTADDATVAISGKFDEALAYRAARRFFGAWLKSDKLVPSTFEQPEAPSAGTEMLTANGVSNPFAAYALRGFTRNDKDFAAAEILARVVLVRVKENSAPQSVAEAYAENEAHILPGSFVSGFVPGADGSPANLVTLLLAKPISDTEFNAAKAEVLASRARIPAADLWLDVDTFKLASVKNENASFGSASLADVQMVAERLSKHPVASVIVKEPEAVKDAQ